MVLSVQKKKWGSFVANFTNEYRNTHLLHLSQLPPCVLIIPKILFVAHKDDWDIGTKMFHLRCPFLRNVLYKNKIIATHVTYQ